MPKATNNPSPVTAAPSRRGLLAGSAAALLAGAAIATPAHGAGLRTTRRVPAAAAQGELADRITPDSVAGATISMLGHLSYELHAVGVADAALEAIELQKLRSRGERYCHARLYEWPGTCARDPRTQARSAGATRHLILPDGSRRERGIRFDVQAFRIVGAHPGGVARMRWKGGQNHPEVCGDVSNPKPNCALMSHPAKSNRRREGI